MKICCIKLLIFLLKKVNCLQLYNLEVKVTILFIKLEKFNKNIKCNFLI